ncbi:MAG: 30S ribosomal protein S8 [Rickettsiales bacterium]|nr:30S ribosomal protein S8 [Pseudomonadota bacterium]MDG4544091.1 30S ribosomal protein S8 [Rickettsiales bacterium]PIR38878.1 MAG: 30S ribosomal protein S8 [Alphaproteobacteria bacterium CG11_big_fil_rev_8_21_14_0_20_39_49]MDA0967248.1 30S ribosomal protein S8 [Pseudomonadota bacterium]MDG4546215.1 30S ribosomal protein S8 [Rickettsiales bacterium]
MSMTDPLADMITRIRNGQQARLYTVTSPFSKERQAVADVLKREGYIRDFQKIELDNNKAELKIELKYLDGEPVIKMIKKVSKPGRRVYSKIAELQKIFNGLGISIISTPKGVLSDHEARQHNVGGEVLVEVF